MSNLGLERYLEGQGPSLARTKVGDRYVVEHMRAHGFNVGGEQSGHIVLSDYATTGDGLLAALQVLAEVVRQGKPVSEVCNLFDAVAAAFEERALLRRQAAGRRESEDAIADAEKRLGNTRAGLLFAHRAQTIDPRYGRR